MIHHGEPYTNHLGVSLALRKCQTRYNFSKRCRTGGKYEPTELAQLLLLGFLWLLGLFTGLRNRQYE